MIYQPCNEEAAFDLAWDKICALIDSRFGAGSGLAVASAAYAAELPGGGIEPVLRIIARYID